MSVNTIEKPNMQCNQVGSPLIISYSFMNPIDLSMGYSLVPPDRKEGGGISIKSVS